MSRAGAADTLPPTARSIALLLASTPTVQDAQPGVLHQLLEFSHRYTAQVLSDALVYAEHAGRAGKIEMDDIVLAVQARVGWEFGGRIPKEVCVCVSPQNGILVLIRLVQYILSLAAQTNAVPLPSVPEVFGVRLPPMAECLTSIDFDLVPNKPPPGVKLYDEEVEEVEESEDEDEDMEPAAISGSFMQSQQPTQLNTQEAVPAPVGAMHSPQDVGMLSPVVAAAEEVSEGEDAHGLFSGGEEEEEESGDEAMDVALALPTSEATAGTKRKLVEEDDYD